MPSVQRMSGSTSSRRMPNRSYGRLSDGIFARALATYQKLGDWESVESVMTEINQSEALQADHLERNGRRQSAVSNPALQTLVLAGPSII